MGNVTFERTLIWRRTLAAQNIEDEDSIARDILRCGFLQFRERAKTLGTEIARSMPELTVHDISHLDALWEIADLLTGNDITFTPAEAFVLGGSFLVHDLGLSLAAYPGGAAEVRGTAAWRDAVASILRRRLLRAPVEFEITNADAAVASEATTAVLRQFHAERAERLATISWKGQDGVLFHLIEHPDLRRVYGPIIGRIAHSHWWSSSRLPDEFRSLIGAPAEFPGTWTVDPLKLACVVRLADAAHLDSSRAPAFLQALRQPAGLAATHWTFQHKLMKVRLDRDRLVYTAAEAFRLSEASAWWLCYDTLRMVDDELRHVDAVMADCGRPQPTARGVAGIEDPRRLTQFIPTDGWVPVDTRVRVSDVASLVKKLGGTELYADTRLTPLRELVQNARDAIVARRILENRAPDWGEIIVSIERSSDGVWFNISDSGVGMSDRVLCGPLVDFGQQYWGSELMCSELPSLNSTSFESVGKYGIGFFSVFMWSDRVQVISRRFDAAQRETQVLEFDRGIDVRPVLRTATERECLQEGGTRVRVLFSKDPREGGGAFATWDLNQLCQWTAPALDVSLYTEENRKKNIAVSASDWIAVEPTRLLARLCRRHSPDDASRYSRMTKRYANHMRHLFAGNTEVVGRACLTSEWFEGGGPGAVVVGGIRCCGLSPIAGILIGDPIRASRDSALPIVSTASLAAWASEQARLVAGIGLNDEEALELADEVRKCGGNTGQLPIAVSTKGRLRYRDLRKWKEPFDEILILDQHDLKRLKENYPDLVVYDHVLASRFGSSSSMLQMGVHYSWPSAMTYGHLGEHYFWASTAQGGAVQAISERWGVPFKRVLDKVYSKRKSRPPEPPIGKTGNREIKADALKISRRSFQP